MMTVLRYSAEMAFLQHFQRPVHFFTSITSNIVLILLISLFSLSSGKSSPSGPNDLNLNALLERIVGNFFNCEIVYAEQKVIPSIPPLSLLSNNYTLRSEEKSSFRDFRFSRMSRNSAGVQIVSVGVNITYPRHEDIHRHANEHCSLGVILLNRFDHEIERWLVETLIPRYSPILRKDEDSFIFILPTEETANRILLSPYFGSKIKYKLAVFKADTAAITCKTVDLYGDAGNSQIIVLEAFKNQNFNVGNIEATNLFPDFTTYFHGKAFRFAIPKVAFRFEIEMRADGKYHPKRGFYKWWLDEAMMKFNFTYDIFQASFGGGTGKRLKNGTWVGATGDIFYGKADCSFIVGEIYSRHKFLGWSSSISYEWVIFMTHIPRHSYSPKAIFKPFTPLVWSFFFLALIGMTLALKSVAFATFDQDSIAGKWSYVKMFEYMFSTLMEQDQVCPLHSHSIRVLCAFWLLFTIVTATAFRGKLVSLIAFPVNTWVPTTFEELANSNFKIALNVVGKAGAAYVLIASSTSPVFKTITSRMELIPESENCLQRAMEEDLGCIIWKGIADYAMVKNLTDKNGHVPLQESSQIALFIGDGLVYERRAIFGKHLDRTIQAVVQMGLTIKWFQLDQEFVKKERRIWEGSRNVTQSVYKYDKDGPKKLVVSQFSGLFLLGLVGYVIACGQLVFEVVQHKRKSIVRSGFQRGGVGENIKVNSASNDDLFATHEEEVRHNLFENNGGQIPSSHNPVWHYTKFQS